MRCRTEDANPLAFEFKYSTAAYSKSLDAFNRILENPEIQVVSWQCTVGETKGSPERQNHEQFLRQVKAARFPAANIEMLTGWTVRSYREFADMEIVAEKRRLNVGLSLMSFEFEKGREAQVEILVTPKKKYGLWFSFDDPAHSQKVSELLDVKLKELD